MHILLHICKGTTWFNFCPFRENGDRRSENSRSDSEMKYFHPNCQLVLRLFTPVPCVIPEVVWHHHNALCACSGSTNLPAAFGRKQIICIASEMLSGLCAGMHLAEGTLHWPFSWASSSSWTLSYLWTIDWFEWGAVGCDSPRSCPDLALYPFVIVLLKWDTALLFFRQMFLHWHQHEEISLSLVHI